MATDMSIPRSRRALLGAAAGAAAATAVGAVLRPLPAAAAAQQATYVNDQTNAVVVSGQSVHQAAFPNSGHGVGVYGFSSSQYGVHGTNGSTGYGVYGDSLSDGTGVWGESQSGVGMHGTSVSSFGGYFYSNAAVAMHAASASGTLPAVQGWAKGGQTGIQGYSGSILPSPVPGNTGVWGTADQGSDSVGVHGGSRTGRGGLFNGKLAQLRLAPSKVTHPTSGAAGDLFVDKDMRLWFCKGGTNWKQIA